MLLFSSTHALSSSLLPPEDGAEELGAGVRAHSGADLRGQHDGHGHAHARPLQDHRDARPPCKHTRAQFTPLTPRVPVFLYVLFLISYLFFFFVTLSPVSDVLFFFTAIFVTLFFLRCLPPVFALCNSPIELPLSNFLSRRWWRSIFDERACWLWITTILESATSSSIEISLKDVLMSPSSPFSLSLSLQHTWFFSDELDKDEKVRPGPLCWEHEVKYVLPAVWESLLFKRTAYYLIWFPSHKMVSVAPCVNQLHPRLHDLFIKMLKKASCWGMMQWFPKWGAGERRSVGASEPMLLPGRLWRERERDMKERCSLWFSFPFFFLARLASSASAPVHETCWESYRWRSVIKTSLEEDSLRSL